MITVTGVRFKPAGKIYYFLPNGYELDTGDFVIVETARGIEFGEVVITRKDIEDEETIAPIREVIRIANEEDVENHCENMTKAKEAFVVCAEKIKEHDLDMKLIDVEYTFDRSKVLFYFVSENRIDFRDLVKDLASTFKTRIELRQVGIRDHARLIGGLGICGREFCCSSCMGDFQPVSIKMAKEQGLSLNPTKISGNCGKLLCCLKYEQEAYESAMKIVPQVGTFVKTEMGDGCVVANNLLRETVSVKFEQDNETDINVFPVSEVTVMNSEEAKAFQQKRQKEAEEREQRKLARAAAEAERKRQAEENSQNRSRNGKGGRDKDSRDKETEESKGEKEITNTTPEQSEIASKTLAENEAVPEDVTLSYNKTDTEE